MLFTELFFLACIRGFQTTKGRGRNFIRSQCSARKHLKTKRLIEIKIEPDDFISQGNRLALQITLRVDVYKNRTRVGHSSKIDFAQILSRCSLLCV